jgi:hypothetical protein
MAKDKPEDKEKRKSKQDNLKKKEIIGTDFSLARATTDQDIQDLMDNNWEPFAVDRGKVYLKKK